MGAYGNSFSLLIDEDGEVDVSKLKEKAAVMGMKKKIQEIEDRKNALFPSWRSIGFPNETNNIAKEEEGDEWKVRESKPRRDGGGEKGGDGGLLEKKEVKKKEEDEEEEGRESEELLVYEGLLVEEITKGKQKMRRITTKRKKAAAAYRKIKGKDRHSRRSF
ncbi:hypothetical protein ACOSQ2_016097 [Xanthoceras sorbifolium]